MQRDYIIGAIKTLCADLAEEGEWTPDDGFAVAELLNLDAEPMGLFMLMDDTPGDWRVGYRTDDGREWFHILRQMRNTPGSGLFENMRRKS